MVGLLFAWKWYWAGHLAWDEEVKLVSGEVILVKRTAKTASFGEIGGAGGWENKGMTLEIVKPQKSDNPPMWNYPFVPIVFDFDASKREWFVVATFYSCQSWYDLGRPQLPYTEFRVRNGVWIQMPLSPELIGREANMLTAISSGGEPSLHTLSSKWRRMNDVRTSKRFLEIATKWTNNC